MGRVPISFLESWWLNNLHGFMAVYGYTNMFHGAIIIFHAYIPMFDCYTYIHVWWFLWLYPQVVSNLLMRTYHDWIMIFRFFIVISYLFMFDGYLGYLPIFVRSPAVTAPGTPTVCTLVQLGASWAPAICSGHVWRLVAARRKWESHHQGPGFHRKS